MRVQVAVKYEVWIGVFRGFLPIGVYFVRNICSMMGPYANWKMVRQ